jgi:hypothetical protein
MPSLVPPFRLAPSGLSGGLGECTAGRPEGKAARPATAGSRALDPAAAFRLNLREEASMVYVIVSMQIRAG